MFSKNMTANSTTKDGHAAGMTDPVQVSKSETKNGISKTDHHLDNCSSLKRTLEKSHSSTSLNLSSLTLHDNYAYARQGSPRPMSRSREHLVSRGNGRSTIGHEPGFRERLPSFRRAPESSQLQTHFAVYKFLPRHEGELALGVGDAIYVQKVHEDLWCEGRNLRTGENGIFPNRYVSDILSYTGTKFEFSEYGVQFFLRFLGSVEVFEFKGNTILCQAIAKILSMRNNSKLSEIPPCSLEINYKGIRLVDHAQENEKRQSKSLVGRLFNNEHKASTAKLFFKLKDVTFCGCYPNSPRYFGFVTKHPSEHRFACHTFMSEFSTEPVAKAIGQAFKRFSAEYFERSSSR